MSTITLVLPIQTEQKLQKKAQLHGQSLETYVQCLLEEDVLALKNPLSPKSSAPDFELQLDALSNGLPPLPVLPIEFSRADIYGEHA